jgi:hypothetical protein
LLALTGQCFSSSSCLKQSCHRGLQLGADREAAAGTALAQVQREAAQANPDAGRVTQAFGRFVGYISEAGRPVVTALLMLTAQHVGMPQQ